MNPFRRKNFYLIASFFGLILVGMIFLKMPFVTHTDGVSWEDAFFTSAAAVCVTNMCNLATSGFNVPGQLVLLGLIQIGGLGMMALAVSLVMLIGQGIGDDSHTGLGSNRHLSRSEIQELIRTVINYTFAIEGIGFILLTLAFMGHGMPLREAGYYGLFHSVSAFCNAGFTPFANNLAGVNSFVKIIISLLIIAGGLGFFVIYDLMSHFKHHTRLQINSKIVLIASAILITGGAVAIKVLEAHHISWLDSYFMAVSARSAGFFTVAPVSLHAGSLIIISGLMLIGCSPNSTGGGIHTTAIAMIFLAVYNAFKGNTKLLLFRREIPLRYALRAFAVTVSFLATASLVSLIISTLYGQSLKVVGFEICAAISNAGMPLTFDESQDFFIRLMTAGCMFLGRIGPLTIFLFFLRERRVSRLAYPQERIILG